MPDVKLQAILTLKDKMSGELKKSEGALKKFGKVAGVAAGAFAVGVGVKAVKAAADFEQSMTDVSTLLAGDSTDSIKKFEKGIKDMMKRVPKSADELGASAYAIVSAGFSDTSEALNVLEQSARLGTAGLGTTEEATKLLTVAMNAFEEQGLDAEQTSDILFKTVKNGITTVGDLSQAFGKMAGNAVSANITLEDASAATAALSSITGKTAESQNALAQVFLELTQEGGKLDTQLQDNGSSLEDLNAAIAKDGLLGGMQNIIRETGLSETEFKNLFSSAEGGTAVFQLLTAGTDAFATSQEDMTEGANAVDEAFRKQNESAKNQFQVLQNQVNVALIDLGNVILPMLIDLIPKVTGFVNDLKGGFEALGEILLDIENRFKRVGESFKGGGPFGFMYRQIKGFVTGGGRQFGGSVSRGQPYLVGEQGPELFVPRQGGRIMPSGQSGGEITINFNNPTVRSQQDLDAIIAAVKNTLNRDLALEQIGV